MANEKTSQKSSTPTFDLQELSSLLEMLEQNNVTEFELERGDEKLKLKRSAPIATTQNVVIATPVDAQHGGAAPLTQAGEEEQPKTAASLSLVKGAKEGATTGPLHDIKSPMVGTFYRRPAPDAKAYVEVGDIVKKGDVLCIVEAMKLMNEIESEISGRIVEVCLEDAQMAEYGEVLFRVSPSI